MPKEVRQKIDECDDDAEKHIESYCIEHNLGTWIKKRSNDNEELDDSETNDSWMRLPELDDSETNDSWTQSPESLNDELDDSETNDIWGPTWNTTELTNFDIDLMQNIEIFNADKHDVYIEYTKHDSEYLYGFLKDEFKFKSKHVKEYYIFCWECRCRKYFNNKYSYMSKQRETSFYYNYKKEGKEEDNYDNNKSNFVELARDHKNKKQHEHNVCSACKTDHILRNPDVLWKSPPTDYRIHGSYPCGVSGNLLAWLTSIIPVKKWHNIYCVYVSEDNYYKFNPVDFYFSMYAGHNSGPREIMRIEGIAMHGGGMYSTKCTDNEYTMDRLEYVNTPPFVENLNLKSHGLRKFLKTK
jgi:hypothetical protein